jgi:hypothetical protein
MELNELKKAWGKVSEAKDQSHLVNREEIVQILRRKSSGIIAKLERNVKIGFWFLGIFILLTIADQYFPSYIDEKMKTPLAISIIGIIVNCLLMFTFILFVYRFHKLNIKSLASNNIKNALRKVVQLLDTFKKEFYLALIILLLAQGAGFFLGFWEGISYNSVPGDLNLKTILLGGLIILIVMSTLIAFIFYLFHKGFDSLYGKYRRQLIATLNELEETTE